MGIRKKRKIGKWDRKLKDYFRKLTVMHSEFQKKRWYQVLDPV